MTETDETAVLAVEGLTKTFRLGFFRKRVEAVRGVDFAVRKGEIFGLLGPNGAGKTTTIKMILRLIFPTSGTIRVFGRPNDDRASMQRVGYMPENPYVYQYLRPLEFLDLCGRLHGLGRADRDARARAMIERVGLTSAIDRPIGKFSKGMMQRIGLAQALLHDPEVLVLDEPMSGLDPIGRKEIRDVLLEQKKLGKTLVFTSHILSDVEMLCDRVVIMNRGLITARGTMDELLSPEVRRVEIELTRVTDELRETLREMATVVHVEGDVVHLVVEGDEHVPEVLDTARTAGARIGAVIPQRETLEDLFVRDAVKSARQ
jgi:ABC-2 type transport system ATP-binding protein